MLIVLPPGEGIDFLTLMEVGATKEPKSSDESLVVIRAGYSESGWTRLASHLSGPG
jgi:hypothetical protein